jgi:hypothetical protein
VTGTAAPSSVRAPTARPQPPPGTHSPSTRPSSPAATGDGTPADFAGVQLRLPAGWRLEVIGGFGGLREGCVLAPGAKAGTQSGCALVVRSFQGFPPPEGSADAPYFFADADMIGGYADDAESGCRGGDERFVKPVKQTVTVGGRSGEFRKVTLDCGDGTKIPLRQWAFTDEPNVVLISYSTDTATIDGILAAARLPAGSGTRTTDFGVLRKVTAKPGGPVTVTLDREVAASGFGPVSDDGAPTDENDNPKTYELPLADDVLVRSAITLCPDRGVTIADGTSLGTGKCTVSGVRAAVAAGGTGPVWIRYDGSGQVAAIVEAYRP